MLTLPPYYATFTKSLLDFTLNESMPTELRWTLYKATISVNILFALPLLSPPFLVSGLQMEMILSKMAPILHLSLYSHPTATMRVSFYKMTENME